VSAVWISDAAKVLRQAGVKVVEEQYESGPFKGRSWKSVSASGTGYPAPGPRFVMWHHDASPAGPSYGALAWMKSAGPAANMWVAEDGTWHVYCAGVSWHAGAGGPGWGVAKDQMNWHAIGIETDMGWGQQWKKAQLDSLRRGTAALMRHYGMPSKNLLFHRTWTDGGVDGVPTLPTKGRKNDPYGLNLKAERRRVARLMGTARSGWRGLLDRWTSPVK